MPYAAYSVFTRDGRALGSVEAQSPEEAVYRLMGGDWGRADFVALSGHDRPMAAAGLVSFRYPSPYGFVMIGARDKADALNEARRSVNGVVDPEQLEIWSAHALRYVKA